MLLHGLVLCSIVLHLLVATSQLTIHVSNDFTNVVQSANRHLFIQIHSIFLTLDPGSTSLRSTSKVQATLAQVLQLVRGEVTHAEQSHRVEWSVTHAVCFEIQLSGVGRLIFSIQEASIFHQSLESLKGRLTQNRLEHIQFSN